MSDMVNGDDVTESDMSAAYKVLQAVRDDVDAGNMSDFVEIIDEAQYIVQQYDAGSNWNEPKAHLFEVGDYAIDDVEPTPSPEVNTVEIVGLVNERADEFVVEETGKTVAEHKHNRYYPEDDLVVKGVYPHMGDPDKVWHFPESRLRKA